MADATVHGVRLHCQRIGQAGAKFRVAFIHGLIVDNLASLYFSLAGAVVPFADVLLFDLRGHGRSDRPASGYALSDMVLDLDGVLDFAFGPGPVCLVGNSFGALVAIEFARRFPERTAGLVLIDGHLGNAGFAEGMVRTLSMRGAGAERAIAESFRLWPGQTSERKIKKLKEQARALVDDTSLIADLGSQAPLSLAAFEDIQVPTLAFYGEESDLVAGSLPLLSAMPNCTVSVLPGCTHSVLWEATDHVRSSLVGFCQRLQEAG
jgi:pimeloyl-ACP methyl ester carboxylesterase